MTVLDLFCGGGGFSVGFKEAGFKIKYGIDLWKGCQETYQYNHPNAEFINDDIRNQDPYDYKDVEILIGSPPCKHFSRASNKRDCTKGMELVCEFRRWVEIIKPKVWIMENVSAIKSHLNRLYYPVVKILNASHYGVPQNRLRCFSGKFNVPRRSHSSNINQISVDGIIYEPIAVISDVLNLNFGEMIDELRFKPSLPWRKKHKPLTDENLNIPSRTVTTKDDNIYMKIGEKGFRKLRIEEIKEIQSFPKHFKFFGSKTAIWKMIGNAVPPLLSYKLALANKLE
jgi:DNA (cytosine-5)-methyltransferase 1